MLMAFDVKLEDRVGAFQHLVTVMAGKGVKILSLAANASGPDAVLGIVGEEDARLREALQNSNLPFEENALATVTIGDSPEELVALTRKLADGMINLKSIYILAKVGTDVQYGFVSDNPEKIDHILSQEGYAAS